jgi:hypothetical protein
MSGVQRGSDVVEGSMRFAGTIVAVMGAALCAVADAQPPRAITRPPTSDYVLAPGRAGGIELGTSVDDLYRLFGKDNVHLVDLFKEGMFSPALEITLGGAAMTHHPVSRH